MNSALGIGIKKKKKQPKTCLCENADSIQTKLLCMFGKNYFCQLILLFSLFLLLFMDSVAIFGTIYESHHTISVNFYFYLQYFQQKIFQFQQNKLIPNKLSIDIKVCYM